MYNYTFFAIVLISYQKKLLLVTESYYNVFVGFGISYFKRVLRTYFATGYASNKVDIKEYVKRQKNGKNGQSVNLCKGSTKVVFVR